MVLNADIINFVVIAVAIMIIIHMLFKKNKLNINNKIDQIVIDKDENKKEFEDDFVDGNNDENSNSSSVSSIEGFDAVRYNLKENRANTQPCPVKENDKFAKKYITKYLFDSGIHCPNKVPPVISKKQFHNDFFNFRDKTYNSSSFREDPVDKIKRLYLDGNRDIARRYPNMKIMDLFDEITRGPKLYERQCVRLPYFDNVNHDGYYVNSGSSGLRLTRNNWNYENEKVMNGGSINGHYYPHDLHASTNYQTVGQ